MNGANTKQYGSTYRLTTSQLMIYLKQGLHSKDSKKVAFADEEPMESTGELRFLTRTCSLTESNTAHTVEPHDKSKDTLRNTVYAGESSNIAVSLHCTNVYAKLY